MDEEAASLRNSAIALGVMVSELADQDTEIVAVAPYIEEAGRRQLNRARRRRERKARIVVLLLVSFLIVLLIIILYLHS